MYKIACDLKTASCIVGTLLTELEPACKLCSDLEDDYFVLALENGLTVTGGPGTTITGHSSMSGALTEIQLTEYGFNLLHGDPAEVERVRKARCLYG